MFEMSRKAGEAEHRIAAYYDEMQRFYSRFWHRSGVHYGYWGVGVADHNQAVIAMNRLVARGLRVVPGGTVVDAGCGIGGTAIELARSFGHRVVGFTLSKEQARRAERASAKLPAKIRPQFVVESYYDTGLPAGSVQGIFGIESICYANPLREFVREAWRILAVGGRLVVADGFQPDTPSGAAATKRLATFCRAFELDRLHSVEEMRRCMESEGFSEVTVDDITREVLPSAKRIRRLARVGFGFAWAAELIRAPQGEVWRRHCDGGLVQEKMLQERSMSYCVITATKKS